MSDTDTTPTPVPFTERLLHRMGLVAALLGLLYFLYHIGTLPEQMPIHFNYQGKPDRWGGKWVLLLLPLIGMGLWYVLYRSSKASPHSFNYVVSVNEDNIERQYLLSRMMLSYINAVVSSGIAYLTVMTVRIGLGERESLGQGFLWIWLALILGGILFFIQRMLKAK